MTLRTYIFAVAAALIVLIVVITLLRRRQLRERHAIWWLFAGVLALLAGVFPRTLEWGAELTGVLLPVNLVFFVSIAILFLVSIQHAAELTALEAKSRDLAEQVTLLQLRVEELPGETRTGQPLDSKDDRGALPGTEPDQER